MNRKTIVERIAWTLLAIVILGYIGVLGWFKMNEKELVFHPTRTAVMTKDSTRPAYKEIEIGSSEEVRLSCAAFPARLEDSCATWVLFFHGQGNTVFSTDDVARYKILHAAKVNVFAVEYRGFGKSTGEPSEAGLYADAEAGYHYLTTERSVPSEKIVIYGYSLGTGVATELASKVPAAGLVLEGAYTSVAEVGQSDYPYLPVGLLLSQRFESIKKINTIMMPKLFIHAVDDQVVPYSFGRALFAKALEPKTFVDVKGGHTLDASLDQAKYSSALSDFFQKVFH